MTPEEQNYWDCEAMALEHDAFLDKVYWAEYGYYGVDAWFFGPEYDEAMAADEYHEAQQ